MKNKLMLIGIIALAALVGFSMIGCGKEDDPEKAGLTGKWKKDDATSTILEFSGEAFKVNDLKLGDSVKTDGDNRVIINLIAGGEQKLKFEFTDPDKKKLKLSESTIDSLKIYEGNYTKQP
jgi:hypothetical protein